MSGFRDKLRTAIVEAIDSLAADRAYGQTSVDLDDNEQKKHIEQVVNAEFAEKSFVSMVSALSHIKSKLSLLNFDFDIPKEPSADSITVVLRQQAAIGGEPLSGPEVEAKAGTELFPSSDNTAKMTVSSTDVDTDTGLMKLTASIS